MQDTRKMPSHSQPRGPAETEHLRLIWRLFQRNDLTGAKSRAERYNLACPEDPEGWYATAFIDLRLGQPDGALAAISRANRLRDHDYPPWQLHELICLNACNQRADAIMLGRSLVDADVDDGGFFATLSQLLFGLQQFDAARQAMKQALERQPGAAELHHGMASIELALGHIDEARAACKRALDIHPDYADAIYLRSTLFRQSAGDNHIDELRQLIDRPHSPARSAALVHYALAKELEDVGHFDQSFPVLKRGAELYRGTLSVDISEEIAFVDAIRTTWTSQQLAAVSPVRTSDSQGRRPIFVTGLPRTGTTLVERILCAHSQVHSAGELPDFSRTVSRMIEALPGTGQMRRADLVVESTRLDFDALGASYRDQSAPVAGDGDAFIDKFPQNALYLGLIRKALPDAVVVLVRRHPMDACYSMFKQIFTDIYQFSYDLDELAAYFIAHHRLMEHWLDTLGDSVLSIRYEDIVADQDAQSRKLIEFCGLEWEDACLDFHRNPAPSTTASASQVRHRIYSSSVGRWRQFRSELMALEKRLEQAGCLEGW
jgi:tetratricopeptide (TPR) repeat protein